MRSRITALIAAGLTVLSMSGTALADAEKATHYQLALGNSLAQGFQPDAFSPYYRDDGYVALLHDALAAGDEKLALENISCGGESAVSMVSGSQDPTVASSCGSPAFYRHWYSQRTQLAEAVKFLQAHKAKVDLVTIDIGGNDLGFCLFAAADTEGCLASVFTTVAFNLDLVLDELQAAASPETTIVGMTYYNPVACVYFLGDTDTVFIASGLVQALNATLVSVYAAHGVPVADVAGAFDVGEGIALEATAALTWTWFCSADHFGDIHPNDDGHHVISQAFLDVLSG
jgi:lysophospholipase L1-like esterase